MKKQVVIYTCDNCKTTTQVEFDKRPAGWGYIILEVLDRVTKMDICTDCLKSVGNVLGERNKP